MGRSRSEFRSLTSYQHTCTQVLYDDGETEKRILALDCFKVGFPGGVMRSGSWAPSSAAQLGNLVAAVAREATRLRKNGDKEQGEGEGAFGHV